MPQIGATLGVNAFVGFLAKGAFVSAFTSTLIGQAILSVATLGLSRLLQPSPRFDLDDRDAPGQELRVRFQTDHPVGVLVGRMATAGSIAYPNTRGNDNEFLERVFILSDYECASFVKMYGDGEELTLSGDPTAGYVTCTNKYQDADGADMLTVRIHLGTEDQTADSTLIANYAQLDSNFRLRGKAYAIVRMQFDPETAFRRGEPQLIFEMDGAPCFDPREAGHDADDPATWAWTDNPALIAAQYYQGWSRAGTVILGQGLDRSRIPDADLISAANECDETVSLKAGGSEKRYRCGGFIYADRTHRQNIERLLLAMDGEVDDTAGEVRILPGVERTTVTEIKKADIITASTIDLDPDLDPAEGINRVTARHPDPDKIYQLIDLPERTDASYVSADGGADLAADLQFDLVHSGAQGQRLMKRLLERARSERRLQLTLRLKYITLERGDRVTLDQPLRDMLRLDDVAYRVEQRPALQVDGDSLTVAVVLREHPDSIGDWTAADDELDLTQTAVNRPARPALTLSGFSVAAYEESGGASTKHPSGRATWTTPVNPAVRGVIVEVRQDGDNSTIKHIRIDDPNDGVAAFGRLAPGTNYQARYRVTDGEQVTAASAWSSFTTTSNDRVTGVAPGGDLENDVTIRQLGGTTLRALGRALTVFEGQDGDSVTFASNFTATPTVRVLGGTGSTFDGQIGAASGDKHLQNYSATNLTTSGFSIKAKIRGEASGTTSQSDTVGTTGSGSQPDLVGQKSTADEAFDDNYEFTGTVSGDATAGANRWSQEVEVYTDDGTGWVLRGSTTINISPSGSFSESWTVTVTVDGLGQHAGNEFGVSLGASLNVTGVSLSAVSVQYESAASTTEFTATPGTEKVFAFMFESDEGN